MESHFSADQSYRLLHADHHAAVSSGRFGAQHKQRDRSLCATRTVRSFDPCIACAIPVTDPQGEELVQVKVS